MATPAKPAMSAAKRGRSEAKDPDDELPHTPTPPEKRRRVALADRTGRDFLSPLSDELLLRILSFLPLQHLLAVAPVSHRFYHLASDSQLWKALYYARFVLPRAMRIPGFRESPSTSGTRHKLHYSGRRSLWTDGRRGGVVRDEERGNKEKEAGWVPFEANEEDPLLLLAKEQAKSTESVNWKRQYKIRYNWSRGKCAVEELRIGEGKQDADARQERKILAKVVEGTAVTADGASGLRAWDLKSRKLLAQMDLDDGLEDAAPSCMAVDDSQLDDQILDVSVGFLDGSFGVWRLHVGESRLICRYRHEKSSNGELIALAFSFPYLLTATGSVLVSLYTFEVPRAASGDGQGRDRDNGDQTTREHKSELAQSAGHVSSNEGGYKQHVDGASGDTLGAPYLLTSLNSHTSRPPLALSIRKMAATTIASIAYTFTTRQGWSIGIQDLHVRSTNAGTGSTPEIVATRIAYTVPVDSGGVAINHTSLQSATPRRRPRHAALESVLATTSQTSSLSAEPGPTTLCYSHPYLLATLPDNTLVLHLCKSNASSLSISRGIRLWGHTSGISDAEITARGKAVSVSSRGEEMRVWELEGRSNSMGSRSVEIRPGQTPTKKAPAIHDTGDSYDWDERRNWVGFDDEMVIVLKEKTGGGGESLMVYDFT